MDSVSIRTVDLIIRDELNSNQGALAANNYLVTATPIMAGRKISGSSPETPFMTSNFKPKPDTTPLMARIEIEPIEESKIENMSVIESGGVIIKKPNFAKAPDNTTNKFGIFKKDLSGNPMGNQTLQ